jgi:hypothetical protein
VVVNNPVDYYTFTRFFRNKGIIGSSIKAVQFPNHENVSRVPAMGGRTYLDAKGVIAPEKLYFLTVANEQSGMNCEIRAVARMLS